MALPLYSRRLLWSLVAMAWLGASWAGLARAQGPVVIPAPAQEIAAPVRLPACAAPGEMPPVETLVVETLASPCLSEGDDPDAALPVFKIIGRLESEVLMASQSAANEASFGNLQNAVGFRRARLGAEGNIGDQVYWISEFDFAGGDVAFKDVYMAVDQLPWAQQIRVGHFCEPFSLEQATSSNYFSFIERSPADAMDPAYQWGVGMYQYSEDQRATFAVGAFTSGTDSAGNNVGDGNDMAYTGRITWLPLWDMDATRPYLMHLGFAFSQTYPKNELVTFNAGPQDSLLQFSDNPLTPFVQNISVPASQEQIYNLQWALDVGSLSLQAEWIGTMVDQIGGSPVFLHGSYAFASYFLTGEHREYLTKEGCFGGVHVLDPFMRLGKRHAICRGHGAWELTGRFSYLDFSSPNMPLTSGGLMQGDRLAMGTLGLNWYLNDNSRILFNYDYVVAVNPNDGPSAANGFFLEFDVFW